MELQVITYPIDEITGVILTGGKAERMAGQDKGLLQLKGRPMIEYVLDALTPQVNSVTINANRNLPSYSHYDMPVVPDKISDYQGPLAGIASVLAEIKTPYLMVVPCDSPLIPDDLVKRLYSSLRQESAELSVVHDGQRMQQVFALLTRGLLPSLHEYLTSGQRKLDDWYNSHHLTFADFSDKREAFMNINRPEDCNTIMDMLPG